MDALITCHDLRHRYGGTDVLHGLSFDVARGGVFGLLGKNGAGKSTVINILMGFLEPASGTCSVLGAPSHALPPQVRQRIGLLHEGFIQYDFMNVSQLERFHAPFYPHWDRTTFFDLVDRMRMPHDRPLSRMSCGQRSQVVLGLLLAQQPELMILDDYSMGLDVGYRRLFIDFLREYVQARGTTVLLTSHVVQELDRIVDQMIVLKEGRVAYSGAKADFKAGFASFAFPRSEGSDRLEPGDWLSSVEQGPHHTRVYGFFDEPALRARLEALGLPSQGIAAVPMDFEDAFIGLTGKY